MKYDIVIPHFGMTDVLTELCLRCLETIRMLSKDYRIIFVDNASPQFDAVWPGLKQHPHLLVRNTENVGFVRAVNAGIWLSKAPYVVLMNNDTEAVPGWLPRLAEPLTGDVGLSGPRTTAKASWQGGAPAGSGVRILPKSAMLAFFCTMIRRDVFDKVGALDEDFGAGFGDDDHFCWKAQEAGFKLALVQDLVIPHHHRSTFRAMYSPEEIHKRQSQNYATYFRKKAPTMATDEIRGMLTRMPEQVSAVLREEMARR